MMGAGKYLLALGHISPLVFASPTLRPAGTQDVHIVLEAGKNDSLAAVTVWNSAQSEILAKSCSNSLNSGPFKEHPVVFSINEIGTGTLKVGNSSYLIGGGEATNVIDCGRIVSPNELAVHCVIPVPISLDLKPLNKRGLTECFPDGPLSISRAMAVLDGRVATNISSQLDHPEMDQKRQDVAKRINLDKRQRQCGFYDRTELVGNGDPHQNPLHIQLSEAMQCPGHIGCEITHTIVKSFSVGWSASASATWISGGFSVVQTIETGNAHTCPGVANDYLAVWKHQAQTAYTVRSLLKSPCYKDEDFGTRVIWSPNENNRGGFFYCVYGKQFVRSIGDRYIEKSGRAGGP